MERFSSAVLGMALTGVVLMSAGVASAEPLKAVSEKEEVAALRQQIAQLQGKVAVLEQKFGAQSAAGPVVPPAPAVYAYDPFEEMNAMERNMQAMMGPSGPGMGMIPSGRNLSGMFNPDYDIKEIGQAYILTFDMPGMDKSKINVEVRDGVLLVSGERASESQEGQGNKVYRQQRSFGYFSRSIPLPRDAKPDGVQARYDNGVLIVTVNKKEAAPPKAAAQKVEIK